MTDQNENFLGVYDSLGHRKTKVVFVQLGSPKSPKVSDVRTFLKEFLGDPRVVDINPTLWKIILNLFVIPFRPARSAKLYSRIWNGESFPLIDNTKSFSDKVSSFLKSDKVEVEYAFLLSSPRVDEVWDRWEREVSSSPETAATELLIIPMFPQYSESTVASGMDGFFSVLKTRVQIPPFKFLTNFHRSKAFIDNSVVQIDNFLERFERDGKKSDKLIISFHGIPKRRVLYKNDIYYKHCFETYFLIKSRVKNIDARDIVITFQSRFGSEEWLTPYTEDVMEELIDEGAKNIAVYCPSFVADCLETTDEIATELAEEAKELGGEIQFIECLNDDKKWCEDFSHFVENQCEGSGETKAQDFYYMQKEDYKQMEKPSMKSEPLSANAKSSLKIVFLTLFLDLVGFSIIFPLFPALAKHYISVDGDNFFLNLIFNGIETLTATGGAGKLSSIVLFGGALGALYSFLQFIAAPVWGRISDRIGRKPVLLVSVFGLALSYVLWFFSGSFTTLIIARFIGGIMGGNISTATAVVADVTSKGNRSKGMATIGIAFALGFIIGPAMGGIMSLIDLTKSFPELAAYGVNPFSMAAGIAFILSAFNLFFLYRNFKESLPEEKRGNAHSSERTFNPLQLFKPLPYEGVNLTNFGHFLFLMAFSGMEFTLTFLAVERMNYSSMDNAYMFIFIGFIIAMVQGGFVRRKAGQIGEKKVALMGLICLIPGLISIGLSTSSFLLYVGLFFLAVGSSMAIPCLTSLVSLYTPAAEQGHSIGIFRSLGALSRVIGPIIASIIYWKFGSSSPYFLGSAFLIIPIILISMLKKPNEAI
ncbi:ferrochelatase [Halobacteriovorax marinus SJ]|uniref:Ferrochelatase n=1 Tax=Halobacteriovorax marinus (strain ATCC BAA-682 / DSM 15412 / SJ) TaxID=862908 RepID=E1X3L9_HALMS|nr:ferrochelatase [Halobacteriovorax marinus]CBW26948.1 ferrochelatase [Halobacteriovorax marinus SJ]